MNRMNRAGTKIGGGVLQDGLTGEDALQHCLGCQGMIDARENAEKADTLAWLVGEARSFCCTKEGCPAGWIVTKKESEPDSITPGGWAGCNEVQNRGGIIRRRLTYLIPLPPMSSQNVLIFVFDIGVDTVTRLILLQKLNNFSTKTV